MANIVGNIAIGSAVLVALLSLIDWILTERQKNKLSDHALRAWVWLDDNRSIDFLSKFKDYKAQVQASASIQAMITGVFAIVAAVLWFTESEDKFFVLWAAIGMLVAAPVIIWWLHPMIISWITKVDLSLAYLWRSTISVVPILLILIAFPQIGEMFQPPFSIASTYTPVQSGLLGIFLSTASVILYLWYINLALFIGWMLSYWSLGLSRLVLVRVVEHPKGIVLGLSALAAAIGALIKALLDK